MATWRISNYEKKNAIEIEYWSKDGKGFRHITGFRWGNFRYEGEDRPEVDLDNEYGFEPYGQDEEWELESLEDGCWAEFEFDEDDWTDEEKQEIEDLWEEDSYNALEDIGCVNTETEIILRGPLLLENLDTGESWTGKES